MSIIKKMMNHRLEKQIEVEKLGYKFSPIIDLNKLSVNELTDLSNLAVGESTFILIDDNSGCDVVRTA